MDFLDNRRFDLFAFAIIILIGLMYWLFYEPVLYSDDWWFNVEAPLTGQLDYGVSFHTNARLLVNLPRHIQYDIAGLNFHFQYAFLWVVDVSAIIVFYLLLRRVMPEFPVHSLTASILLFLYPADFTHTWLTMISIRISMVFLFLYGWALYEYILRSKIWLIVAANLLLLLTYMLYDGSFGIATAWCVLMGGLIYYKTRNIKRVAVALSPLVIGVMLIVWRVVISPAVVDNVTNSARLSLQPGTLFRRLTRGYQILIWAWTAPIREWLEIGSNWVVLGGLLGVEALLITVASVLNRGKNTSTAERDADRRRFLRLLVGGGVLCTAGFVPVIAAYTPVLTSLDSRFNLFALPGAAVMLVAGLGLIAAFTVKERRAYKYVVLAGALPLVVIGILVQVQNKRAIQQAWYEQTSILTGLYDVVPDIEDHSGVIVVVDNYANITGNPVSLWKRTPFYADWDVSSALRVAYANETLSGGQLLLDRADEYVVDGEGIRSMPWAWRDPLPDEILVLAYYDQASGTVTILDRAQAEAMLDTSLPDYDPTARIGEHLPEGTTYRIR